MEESRRPRVEPTVVPYRFAKRAFDVVAAGLLLLLLFPLFVVIAILVRLGSKGPILYRSERIGMGGEPFLFPKFRSMYVDAEERLAALQAENEKDGPIFKMKNDPRITPIGRFLRKYSLDELPQLLCVLKGDMSMVGPRPPIAREVAKYDEFCLHRLSIKPGLTCYWQIMGRSDLTFAEWMELDHRYIREMSLWVDLKILAKTPMAVLRGQGAY